MTRFGVGYLKIRENIWFDYFFMITFVYQRLCDFLIEKDKSYRLRDENVVVNYFFVSFELGSLYHIRLGRS